MSALTARVIVNRDLVDEIVPAWNTLLDDAAQIEVFSTPEWQLTWLDSFPGVSPRYVAMSDETGRMRALLPLGVRTRRVGPFSLRALELGGEAVACGDHLGLIACPADAGDAWAASAPLVRSCAAEADLVRFASMDAAEAAAALAVTSMNPGWAACHPPDDVAPRMMLPPPTTDVLGAFRSSRRAKLRYYERQFASSHPSASVALNDERMPLDDALDALDALHASRWRQRGETGVLADPPFMTFVRRFSRLAHERGWLRLYQMFVEDRVVATLLTLHRRDVASGWLLGWNPAFAKWNVSELLWLHSVREAAREGLHTFDFLRGGEAYKFRFPVEPSALLCRQWTVTARGRVAVGTALAGERVLASARRWRTRAYRVAQKLRRAPD